MMMIAGWNFLATLKAKFNILAVPALSVNYDKFYGDKSSMSASHYVCNARIISVFPEPCGP